MGTNSELTKVEKDLVVGLVYELKVDGEVIDFAREDEPLEFLQGHGQVIPGLESQVEGMTIGETKEVFVKAADAYGEFDPEGFTEIPKSEFPTEIPLEVGTEIEMEDEDGEELSGFIEEVALDSVTINFNHPLAGRDLAFHVKVVSLRKASQEELEHGHVHFDEHEHQEE